MLLRARTRGRLSCPCGECRLGQAPDTRSKSQGRTAYLAPHGDGSVASKRIVVPEGQQVQMRVLRRMVTGGEGVGAVCGRELWASVNCLLCTCGRIKLS